jgi:hypothetical protein
LRLAVLKSTVFPSLILFATAIMIFWYLESIGAEFHFSFGLLCFVDFAMVIDSDNYVLTHFLAPVSPTDQRDLSIFSPLRIALPSFASQVVFHLLAAP